MARQYHGVTQVELGGEGAETVGGNGEGIQLQFIAGDLQRLDHTIILPDVGVGGAIQKLVARIPAIQDPQPHLAVFAGYHALAGQQGSAGGARVLQQIDVGEQGVSRAVEGDEFPCRRAAIVLGRGQEAGGAPCLLCA
ncbi:hypothetical protein D3C75_434730 [compost metagenome]